MAKSKVSSKNTSKQGGIDWSYEHFKPWKLRAIELFKGLDAHVEIFGTRKKLWSKNIIKREKYRELAKVIHMDYDELKTEVELIEREYKEGQRLRERMRRDWEKWRELKDAGRQKEADALIKKMFDKSYFKTTNGGAEIAT